MRAFLQYLSVAFSFVGGVVMLASKIISPLTRGIVSFSYSEIQGFGLALFVVGALSTSLVNAIQSYLDGRNEPRLSINGVTTEPKKVWETQTRQLVGDYKFAYAIVENKPKNEDKGLSAQFANAKIIFHLQSGAEKPVEFLRWCDPDNPLFPHSQGDDITPLKKVDIDPNNPVFLVLAFKRKNARNIYAFYFSDHKKFNKKDIKPLYKQRNLGQPPISATIIVRGKFQRKEFNCVLDLDENGEFVLKRVRRYFGLTFASQ